MLLFSGSPFIIKIKRIFNESESGSLLNRTKRIYFLFRAHNLSIAMTSEPCLNLKVDIKPFSETSDWESSSNCSAKESSAIQQSIGVGHKYVQNMQNRLPGLIMNQVFHMAINNNGTFVYTVSLSYAPCNWPLGRWKKHFRL